MVMLTKKALLLAKIESAYGTDPTPAPATDAVRVIDPQVRPAGEVLEREDVDATLSPLAHLIGARHVEISFSTWLKGSGAAGTAPEIGPLLRACGLGETINAGVSVEYDPVSTGFESVTIWLYLDGVLHKVNGCRGSVAVAAVVGEMARLNFTFQGLYAAPTDAAIAAGAVYDSTKPPVFINGTFTYDSFAAKVKNLEIDLGIETSVEPDPADTHGVDAVEIVGRAPSGSMDPQAVTVATHDFFAKWISGTEAALQAIIGSTAGNIATIDAPKCAKREVGWADRDGVRTFDVPFGLYASTGDDEFKLTLT